MGWSVTVKAGKVRDMKNKRRKTGKSGKKRWVGGDIIDDILQQTFSSIGGVTQDSVREVINNLKTKGLLPECIKLLLQEPNILDKYYNLLPQNSTSTVLITPLDKEELNRQYSSSSIKRCYLNEEIESQYVQLYARPDGHCLYYTLSVIIQHNPMYYKEIQIILIIIYHILLYRSTITNIKDIYNDLYPTAYGELLEDRSIGLDTNYDDLFITRHIIPYKYQLTIRFYGILTNFINTDKKNDAKTRFRTILFSQDIQTVYDAEVNKNTAEYETLIGYGTDKEIVILLNVNQYKIVDKTITLNDLKNDYGKHLLYNCKLLNGKPNNFERVFLGGNHYELLIKCTDAASNKNIDHISTPYGNATRIIDTLFVLDIQLNETSKSKQAITNCTIAQSTIPVAAAASSDITIAATAEGIAQPVGTVSATDAQPAAKSVSNPDLATKKLIRTVTLHRKGSINPISVDAAQPADVEDVTKPAAEGIAQPAAKSASNPAQPTTAKPSRDIIKLHRKASVVTHAKPAAQSVSNPAQPTTAPVMLVQPDAQDEFESKINPVELTSAVVPAPATAVAEGENKSDDTSVNRPAAAEGIAQHAAVVAASVQPTTAAAITTVATPTVSTAAPVVPSAQGTTKSDMEQVELTSAVAQPAAAATPTVATVIAPVPDPDPAIATVLSPVTASPLAAPSAAANPTSSNQPAIVKAAVISGIAKPPKPPSFNPLELLIENTNTLNIVPNITVPQHLYELVNAVITNESYTNDTKLFSCKINGTPITVQKLQKPNEFECTISS
jgi:hypothetical protein